MTDPRYSTYFVLNGLINGEEGMMAIPAGGGDDHPQADGWYFIVDGMDDGAGPYDNQAIAVMEAGHYLEQMDE
jgi:hypothetical protein